MGFLNYIAPKDYLGKLKKELFIIIFFPFSRFVSLYLFHIAYFYLLKVYNC